MKYKDLTAKSDKELQNLLQDTRKELAQAAQDLRVKQVSNVKQIRAHKKTVARVLTLQQQRLLQHKEEAHG
ncbi:50S ribosomal protein L29 [Patescibacteria group bacterium]|nr:MAG: 50S ribosomal protein L29 [Patescibacteria group bacterium]